MFFCYQLDLKLDHDRSKYFLLQDKVASNYHTFSNFFCQYSSLLLITSMQCESDAIIPAVVALNVIASPRKSILPKSGGEFVPLPLNPPTAKCACECDRW